MPKADVCTDNFNSDLLRSWNNWKIGNGPIKSTGSQEELALRQMSITCSRNAGYRITLPLSTIAISQTSMTPLAGSRTEYATVSLALVNVRSLSSLTHHRPIRRSIEVVQYLRRPRRARTRARALDGLRETCGPMPDHGERRDRQPWTQ